MIRLRPRPPAPPQLQSDNVDAKKKELGKKANSENGEIKSVDFPPFWGNDYKHYLLSSNSFRDLAELPGHLLEMLKPLEGKHFKDKSELKKALKETLGNRLLKDEKALIVKCAEQTIPKILWEHHDGKCCYCEKKVYWKREADVEHFRPKSEVTEDTGHAGYWWLAYEWENYLLSCKICNSDYKRNHFPLLADGNRAYSEKDDLSEEKPALIHPIDENPEEFIDYEWKKTNGHLVKAVGVDENGRGDLTVNELTGTNHYRVMEERAGLLRSLKLISELLEMSISKNNPESIEKYSAKLKKQTEDSLTYAGFRRAYFRKKGFGKLIS